MKTHDVAFGAVLLCRKGLKESGFSRFPEATVSCAIAYNYARIRRLVRLVSGLYRSVSLSIQRSGLAAWAL
ncbi:hypothetical protein EMIT0P253_240007 [Pseudomonas sp. IT-P253]